MVRWNGQRPGATATSTDIDDVGSPGSLADTREGCADHELSLAGLDTRSRPSEHPTVTDIPESTSQGRNAVQQGRNKLKCECK